MEFTFNVNDILNQEITKISSNFIPPGFIGDRRKLWDTQSKLSDIINVMGEASAAAQGLTKPITTADRLKNAEHTIYLLVNPDGKKGGGSVMGMLKMGRKGLYVFDRNGQHYQVQPLCVLDFYVHEAMQRMGLGKKLFEHMLKEENAEPVNLAIDRPSEKFLAFLNKHYKLNGAISQMNNFVVFDGFFPEKNNDEKYELHNNNNSCSANSTPSKSHNGHNGLPLGRYGAPRPPCSMGQIIHNHSPTVQPTEPNRCDTQQQRTETQQQEHEKAPPPPPPQSPKLQRPLSLNIGGTDADVISGAEATQPDTQKPESNGGNITDLVDSVEKLHVKINTADLGTVNTTVQIQERANNIIPPDHAVGFTPRTPSNLTEQGFLDLKFYHSRLW